MNHVLALAGRKYVKLTLEQQYMLSVLHSQYHACWCSGDFESQGISRRGIGQISRNIPSLASGELIDTDRVQSINDIDQLTSNYCSTE